MATNPIFADVAPWPDKAEPNPRAVTGNNKPPLEELIPVEFKSKLLEDKPHFLTKLDDYLGVGDPSSEGYKQGSVDRAKCTNDEELGRCGELINGLRQALSHVEATHKEVKAPYLEGGRLVDAEKRVLEGRILDGRDKVKAVQDAYAAKKLQDERDEQKRLADERAKLEEVAKEAGVSHVLPAAPEPEKRSPIRSDGGATVSLGTEFVGTVTDYKKAFNKVKENAAVKEAIDKAIKALVKATIRSQVDADKGIPGVTIREVAKVSSR